MSVLPDGYNTQPLAPILGENSADNEFDSSNVVANANGSMLERLEYLAQNMNGTGLKYNTPNYLAVSITFAAATTGSVATHEILTVTGAVRVRILAECTVNVVGAGTIELGGCYRYRRIYSHH